MEYSNSKDWWFYWLLTPTLYSFLGASFYYLLKVYIKFSKSKSPQPTGKFPIETLLLIISALLMLTLFLIVRNYMNYLYGVEVRKNGVYWRSWDKEKHVSWINVDSIEVYTNIKGREKAIVKSKDGQTLRVDSMAFKHWDSFVQDLSHHSGHPVQYTSGNHWPS